MNAEDKIKEICLEQNGENLAAILIFGSYGIKTYAAGVSDIDAIILLKEKGTLDFEKEQKNLREKLAEINLSIHHFTDIESYKNHIYQGASWSSWITVLKSPKQIYTTQEFEDFKKYLASHELDKEKLKEYILQKDKFELEGYFKQRTGWELTKGIFSHLRRKLQILNYYSGNDLDFDYDKCLANLKLKNKRSLQKIGQFYCERLNLSTSEIPVYYEIAKSLTKKIMKI